MDQFNANDDHPFRNPWHNGSWEAEVTRLFDEHRENYEHITDGAAYAFIQAVGREAFLRGYDDGCPKDGRDYEEDVTPDPQEPQDPQEIRDRQQEILRRLQAIVKGP